MLERYKNLYKELKSLDRSEAEEFEYIEDMITDLEDSFKQMESKIEETKEELLLAVYGNSNDVEDLYQEWLQQQL